jgi:hypothetical protein
MSNFLGATDLISAAFHNQRQKSGINMFNKCVAALTAMPHVPANGTCGISFIGAAILPS